ncbi:hypothetical protein LZ198_28360 [Myxococcus sp. K15C18031901]|uniref:hypothetical protein n=1 Tax=Myxococcus dinghuensis TaxID=2906761 RepID=UPI0020A826EA|nr:hypothetical protein [Myxococcus dinghuensis]MCP3102796.1 hypothetical protein [Myxococcus dinghuensis]
MKQLLQSMPLVLAMMLFGCGGEELSASSTDMEPTQSEQVEVVETDVERNAQMCIPLGAQCLYNSSCCALYCRKVSGASSGICSR